MKKLLRNPWVWLAVVIAVVLLKRKSSTASVASPVATQANVDASNWAAFDATPAGQT